MLDKNRIQDLRNQLKAGVRVLSAPQLFPTPKETADYLIELADIRPDQKILEPSAGTGRLLDALISGGYQETCSITAVELNLNLSESLKRHYPQISVHQADFMEWNKEKYDCIIMNPPFQNAQDIRHIRHAQTLLNAGGKLIAICASGPRQKTAFLEHYSEPLPLGTFKEEGTSVNTQIIIIEC
jgi:tRNA1(Val) A37 N6-methylase TrmN6